ncbi:NAD-dependent protein deacetylase HST1-like [Belonocnema kinseyi]|uniref:NAD-dependent protein deacetylase HST1-like n=1 Tax=Belonocnema kinseyi TaxID=2817044 RepID=UPI00143CC745|nr:NAD-dependent protein deacetylase HST1-like [Belonocnema kinseyi]
MEDKKYLKTVGLLELLLRQAPQESYISSNDLNNYKEILINTSAHRKHYSPSEPNRISNNIKWTESKEKIENNNSNKENDNSSSSSKKEDEKQDNMNEKNRDENEKEEEDQQESEQDDNDDVDHNREEEENSVNGFN